MPFPTRRPPRFLSRRGLDDPGSFLSPPNQLHQPQSQPVEPVKREEPTIPLDPCLLYAEDFRARSQKRRTLIAKALGIRHPDLLHFCIHSTAELTAIRARSIRHQSSLLARRRAKLAKQKLKDKKKILSNQQQSTPQKLLLSPQKQLLEQKDATSNRAANAEFKPKMDVGSVEKSADVPSATDSTAVKPETTDNGNENDALNNNNNAKDDAESVQPHTAQSSLSGGPQNDYSHHFICTGERPANFVRDVGLANRFEEYPKLRDLIRAKDMLIQSTNTPPFFLRTDLSTFSLTDLGTDFDCVLIEPPLEEYQFMGQVFDKYWNWNEIEALNIGAITAPRSFVWIWVGAGEGLDRGRRCLSKWGFRRCEDICWVKTNANRPGPSPLIEPKSLFQRTKEHCLMGIKGTVLRSKDGDFIHANIDLDVIIEEEPEPGVKDKPIEMFHMIEHFCLGRRRLHLFARESTIRPGWVSLGPELIRSNYDAEMYRQAIALEPGLTTGCTEEIERMRPKTPPAVKAAVAAQAAQAQAATGQSVVMTAVPQPTAGLPGVVAPLSTGVLQPSPMASANVMATSLGAALLQHSESPNLGL